jgi:hypothetical protein
VIKYEHTPLHQTVAQLLERLAPVIPTPSIPNPHQGVANRSTKAKRPPPATGEEGGRKKRQKNQDESANQSQTENGPQDQPAETTTRSSSATVNVPVAEAERRREIALNLLNSRGVDPATLSIEQFSIFANQPPHLQEASLVMLAKYGAERLRIIHPEKEKEQGTSASSNSSQRGTPTDEAEAGGPSLPVAGGTPTANMDGTGIAEATPLKSKRTRGACETCKQNKRKCTKQHPQCSVCVELRETCVYLPPKPRKSRSTISTSAVANDLGVGYEAGQATEQQEAYQEAEQGGHQADEQHAGQVAQAEPLHYYTHPASQPVAQRAETAPPAPDVDSDEFIPDPNILSEPIDPPAQMQPSGRTSHYESNVPDGSFTAHGLHAPLNHSTVSSRLSFSRTQVQKGAQQPATISTFTDDNPINGTQQPGSVPFPTPTATSQNARQSMPRDDTGHNLATALSLQAQGVIDPSTTNSAPPSVNWSNMPGLPANTNAGQSPAHTPSPTISYQTAVKRPRSRNSAAETRTQGSGMMQTAAAQQINSAPVNKSPNQNPGQKSSQPSSKYGHRAQTNMAVNQTPVPSAQPPSSYTANPTMSYNHSTTTAGSNPIPTYNPYARIDNTNNDPYSKTGNGQTMWIPNEPHSYKQTPPKPNTAYSTNLYAYLRGASSANTPIHGLHGSTDYSAGGGGNSNAWEGSRDRNSPSSNNQYSKGSNAQPPSTYGSRLTDRQSAVPDTSYAQPTPQPSQSQQSYCSFSQQPDHLFSQQPDHLFSQQPDTHQHQKPNWYGFTSANHHAGSAGGEGTGSRGPVYGSAPPALNTGYTQGQHNDAPGYDVYGHEHDLYDLPDYMRTGGSH